MLLFVIYVIGFPIAWLISTIVAFNSVKNEYPSIEPDNTDWVYAAAIGLTLALIWPITLAGYAMINLAKSVNKRIEEANDAVH